MFDHSFKSSTSNDLIEISYSQQNHKCNFISVTYDKYSENIILLNQLVNFLTDEGITWISMLNKKNYEFPSNTVSYEKGKYINVHLEDFSKFYKKNLPNIIPQSKIYVNKNATDSDGWQVVIDVKSARKDKLKNLRERIKLVQDDWNNL